MKTVEEYKHQQVQAVSILNRLMKFIENGEKFNLENSDELLAKVQAGIDETKASKLKVALVGGFSEGKTSIAAGWSGHYDKTTMKVDVSESSDQVEVIHLEDIDLVDTPGLFGFKQTDNAVKYKEITRKYVSEANLVLYVMNPSNPIKDSHKEELEWLFNDLGLLSRTVFVISKFDEEADIEDPMDFEARFETKKANILGRLVDFGIIQGNQSVPIVAVAANPFSEGLDYWLAHKDEYEQLSNIETLRTATTALITKAGGSTPLVLATSQSIIQNVMERQFPEIESRLSQVTQDLANLRSSLQDINDEQSKTEERINKARLNLQTFVNQYFTDLVVQANGTDKDTFPEFFERNIGAEGIVRETTVNTEFEQQTGAVAKDISKLESSYDGSLQHYNSLSSDIMKSAAKGIKSIPLKEISNETILHVRNFVMPSLKFKPWEAVKLAKGINGALPLIGPLLDIGFEAWNSMKAAKQKQAFEKYKQSVVESLEKERKEYLEMLSKRETFIAQFFPNYLDLQRKVKTLESVVSDREAFQSEFEVWQAEGEAIKHDFVDTL